MKFQLRLLFLMALSLSMGCHLIESRDLSNRPADQAAVTLSEAAISVSHSLNELAEMRRAATPKGKRLVDPSPYQISGIVSIDWSGPVEPLLQKIADMSHYHLRVLGRAPAIPVIVTISAHDTPLVDVIRDIDFQAGDQAKIQVDGIHRLMELRYSTLQ